MVLAVVAMVVQLVLSLLLLSLAVVPGVGAAPELAASGGANRHARVALRVVVGVDAGMRTHADPVRLKGRPRAAGRDATWLRKRRGQRLRPG